jgi:hypothetical protein
MSAMTVDDAVAILQRVAREQPPEPEPARDPELEAAVRALAVHELAMLWQRFLPHVQMVLDRKTDAAAAERIVRALFRGCCEARPSPLVAEPRLVDLAARLRHNDTVGAAARSLLAAAPHDDAVAAVERYPHDPVLPRVPMPERGDFLKRYLGGERSVWNELVEHAIAVAQHDELRDEAGAVATELMKRVRHNADAVRTTLRDAGAELRDEAGPAKDADLARVMTLAGPLPIALDAFWRVVGSIALIPSPACSLASDGLELVELEPLVVRGAHEFDEQAAAHERLVAATHREIVGPFQLVFMPGSPSSIDLPPPTPADAVDPRVHHGKYRVRFVEYLRHAFRWGGFDGLVGHRDEAGQQLRAKLRANLVDF